MKRIIYTQGQKVGRCFYISEEPTHGTGKKAKRQAKFKCECGTIIIKGISDMKTGRVTCGCIRGKAHIRHGYAKAGSTRPEYTTWLNIKRRCYIKTSIQYKDYGGRGIKMCDRWLNSFDSFIADMGNKPTPKHSIERINNNGNYEPSNCKWGTRKEQGMNKRNTAFVEFNGEKLTVMDWSEKLNINYHTLQNRLLTYKWTVENALTKPVRKY